MSNGFKPYSQVAPITGLLESMRKGDISEKMTDIGLTDTIKKERKRFSKQSRDAFKRYKQDVGKNKWWHNILRVASLGLGAPGALITNMILSLSQSKDAQRAGKKLEEYHGIDERFKGTGRYEDFMGDIEDMQISGEDIIENVLATGALSLAQTGGKNFTKKLLKGDKPMKTFFENMFQQDFGSKDSGNISGVSSGAPRNKLSMFNNPFQGRFNFSESPLAKAIQNRRNVWKDALGSNFGMTDWGSKIKENLQARRNPRSISPYRQQNISFGDAWARRRKEKF